MQSNDCNDKGSLIHLVIYNIQSSNDSLISYSPGRQNLSDSIYPPSADTPTQRAGSRTPAEITEWSITLTQSTRPSAMHSNAAAEHTHLLNSLSYTPAHHTRVSCLYPIPWVPNVWLRCGTTKSGARWLHQVQGNTQRAIREPAALLSMHSVFNNLPLTISRHWQQIHLHWLFNKQTKRKNDLLAKTLQPQNFSPFLRKFLTH